MAEYLALTKGDTETEVEFIRRHIRALAWEEGYIAGHSRAMRRMSDEPNVADAPNPYCATPTPAADESGAHA